jgi:hypothetical protein
MLIVFLFMVNYYWVIKLLDSDRPLAQAPLQTANSSTWRKGVALAMGTGNPGAVAGAAK